MPNVLLFVLFNFIHIFQIFFVFLYIYTESNQRV